MKYDSIIFDLDGTLWDSCPSCAIGWNNVLQRNNINFRNNTADDVRSVAGKPHDDCIRTIFEGLDDKSIEILIEQTSQEDNLLIKSFGGTIYEGVETGLKELSAHCPLYIVSNCQDGYIETFLNFSGFHNFFKDYESWGRSRKSKCENLKLISSRNHLLGPVYIGDTMGDFTSAKAAALPFIHVSYGFGSVPDAETFDSFSALSRTLLKRLHTP